MLCFIGALCLYSQLVSNASFRFQTLVAILTVQLVKRGDFESRRNVHKQFGVLINIIRRVEGIGGIGTIDGMGIDAPARFKIKPAQVCQQQRRIECRLVYLGTVFPQCA